MAVSLKTQRHFPAHILRFHNVFPGFFKENVKYPVWTSRDPIFSDFRDPHRVPKTPLKNGISIICVVRRKKRKDRAASARTLYNNTSLCNNMSGHFDTWLYVTSV